MRLARSILVAVAAVAATGFLVVGPFALAVSELLFDVRASIGMSIAVGLLFSLGAGGRIHPWLGVVATFGFGIVAALVLGLVPGRGAVIILPPLQAICCGVLWGVQPGRFRKAWHVLGLTLVCGLVIGTGFYPAYGTFGFFSSLGIAVAAWGYLELVRGVRYGFGRVPVALLVALALGVGAHAEEARKRSALRRSTIAGGHD